MDDVAQAAGTTKPTVYAHFRSKEELFAAVLQFLRDVFNDRIGSPEHFSDNPLEGIARFCGRMIELVSWREALGFHRLVIASAGRSPKMGAEIYHAFHGSAVYALANYLEKNALADSPTDQAERILAATVGLQMLRELYGVGETDIASEPPGDQLDEARVGLDKLRKTVGMFLVR